MFNREIFGPVFNGVDQVFLDPLNVYRRLHYALDGKPNQYLKDRKSEDVQVSFPAQEKLLEAVKFAFGLQPFNPLDGSGTQDGDAFGLLWAFLNWVDKKKSEGRELAEMVSLYGGYGFLPVPLDYETYCSLWLNIPTIRLQRAWDYKTGMVLTRPATELPLSVYEAQAVSPELAPQMKRQADRARFIAEQKRILGWH